MKIEKIDRALMRKALKGASNLLEINKEEVNSLNIFPVPDGDTGTNMSLTINAAVQEGLKVKNDDTSIIAKEASKGSLMGARGNSGVILSQLCRGFAEGVSDKDYIDVNSLANGFKMAAEMAYKAVMKPTEGTILTVARECGDFAQSIVNEEDDILLFLERVIEHGNKTLENTKNMLKVLKEANVVDAGGKGLMYIITGAYYGLAGITEIEDIEEIVEEKKLIEHEGSHLCSDDIKYGYCTEFIINTNYNNIEKLRQEFSTNADSLLVVGGEGIIKVHVHTNNPGLVMERALELGELSDIKIDNMRYQHEEILLRDELEEVRNKKKMEKYAFVAVSIGDGVDEIFKGFKVDKIVSGGQTMNPSTEDILNAIDQTNGENVFVLPNNKNIIWAAEQTIELSDRNVVVVPTKSVPEGIGALVTFDPSISVKENLNNMVDYIKDIETGEVTYAVRDTEVNGKKINKDDIIGLANGEIIEVGEDINSVSELLIDNLMNDDISIITIIYGNGIEEETALELEQKLEDSYPDIDIDTIKGNQPLYYYTFSLE